ncbi:hypothetical protein GCM10017786_67140 [Amycolatopsis deserti]|uniref:Uncharacterized protein n=1 Tax=Amycolatopsis deserti TaxID=185696 RepID=A0ABQ3JEJ0_9PSEU|nr:hypothetical protein GCM10017786_67140 [Amycolatopsis deserti]
MRYRRGQSAKVASRAGLTFVNRRGWTANSNPSCSTLTTVRTTSDTFGSARAPRRI